MALLSNNKVSLFNDEIINLMEYLSKKKIFLEETKPRYFEQIQKPDIKEKDSEEEKTFKTN